jgi:hypothetical protein
MKINRVLNLILILILKIFVNTGPDVKAGVYTSEILFDITYKTNKFSIFFHALYEFTDTRNDMYSHK